MGRALQGLGYCIFPLAIAAARDGLPPERSGPIVAVLGVTTSAGVGIGYPMAGLLVERWGLHAPFWFGAAVCLLGCAAARRALPVTPPRPGRPLDAVGAGLLALATAGLLVALAQGVAWGWGSSRVLGCAAVGTTAGALWARRTSRVTDPLVDPSLLHHRSVLVANVAVGLSGLGIYPLVSLIVRLVEAPADGAGGLGGSPLMAGTALVPFSLASLGASRIVTATAGRSSPEVLVLLSGIPLVAAQALFLLAGDTWPAVAATSALAGLGLGGVSAAAAVLIVAGTPAADTASATAFAQLVRSVGFAAGSALSATVLAATAGTGATITRSGYDRAALASIAILVVAAALVAALVRTVPRPRGSASSTGRVRSGV